LEASLLIVTKYRQALFHIANEHEKNTVLSEVSHCYDINEQASVSLNSIKKPNKASSLPARLCSAEASPGTPEGQQSGAAAAGGTVCDKAVAHGNGGPIENPEHCPFSVRLFFSGHSVLIQKSRGYSCALIVRSRAVDPQRTTDMAGREEKARQYFEELKCTLPKLSPRWWKKDFKSYVDEFIAERLLEKDIITTIPFEDEEEEELDRICLHRIRRLVAGAVQEWELIQQPMYAATCAKLDGALVWQGRGYVSRISHAISLLQPSLQSQFKKISPALQLVIPKSFYKFILSPLAVYR
jgi:hypothetical protein